MHVCVVIASAKGGPEGGMGGHTTPPGACPPTYPCISWKSTAISVSETITCGIHLAASRNILCPSLSLSQFFSSSSIGIRGESLYVMGECFVVNSMTITHLMTSDWG